MSLNRAFRLQSFVQFFCIMGFLAFGNASVSFAASECSDRDKEILKECKKDEYYKGHRRDCKDVMEACDSKKSSSSSISDDSCQSALRDFQSKKDDFLSSCNKAGLSNLSCKAKQVDCNKPAEAEEYKDDASMLDAFAQALGISKDSDPDTTKKKIASTCPKYSGQDFFKNKDKYESNLKDVNRDLKDNKKEIADLNKDFNDDVKKVQEQIADAQKEYQELQTDTKKNQRDRALESAKTAADIAKQIRSLETQILNKHQEISTIYEDKNNSLVQITEAAANRTCMAQVREERKKYDAISSGSMRSQFQSASIKKKQLNDLFNECMVKFDQGRMKLIQESDKKIESAEKQIRDSQSDLDEAKTQLSQMSSLEQEAKQDEQTTLTNAQTALQQKIQRATTELQSLQKATEAKNKALTEEQEFLKTKSKSISNQIALLGATPDVETSSVPALEAANNYEAALGSYNSAKGSCLDKFSKDPFFEVSAEQTHKELERKNKGRK